MSHNQIKVAGQSPNANGEITVNIENLDNVNLTSVADNQVLQYDNASSNWINADTSALSGGSILFVGDGSSTTYPSTGTLGNGDAIKFYNPLFNGISATISTGWIDSITLPAGDYLCNAVVGLTFSTSNGVATYRWFDGSNYVGTQGNVKEDEETIGSVASLYVSSASSITLSVNINAAPTDINAPSSQGTRQAQYGYIEIRKLA